MQQYQSNQKTSKYRFIICFLLVLLNLSFGINLFVVAPVLPEIMDDYAINRSTASLLIGLVLLIQAFLTAPSGMLIGRVKLKKLIAFGWLLAAAPSLSFLAPTFLTLLALRILYAISLSVTIPTLGPLLMQWFTSKELPIVNAIGLAAGSLGVAVSTFLVAPLAEIIGWKASMSIFGFVSFVGFISWVILGKVRDHSEVDTRLSVKEAISVLRSRTTLLVAVADAGPFTQYVALSAWLPTFYFEVHKISSIDAGIAMGWVHFSGIFALLASGFIALRVSRRRPFLIAPGLLISLAGLGTFALAGTIGMYPSLILLGITSWFYLPVLLTIPIELPGATPEKISMVFASIVSIGGILGFIAPLTIGLLADISGSYIPGFCIFMLLASSLALAGYLLPETGSSAKLKTNF